MQREPQSMRPVRVKEPHFPTDAAFRDVSYIVRAELLLQRLLQKRLYGGVCIATSDGSSSDAVQEPAPDLTFSEFVAGVAGRVGEALA